MRLPKNSFIRSLNKSFVERSCMPDSALDDDVKVGTQAAAFSALEEIVTFLQASEITDNKLKPSLTLISVTEKTGPRD